MFSLDTETALIEPGRLAPPMACASWGNERGGTGLWHVRSAEDGLASLFKADGIVGANIAYDMAVIGEQYPALLETVFNLYRDHKIQDIQLNQMLIDIARGCLGGYRDHRGFFHKYTYSLDALHQRHGGEPLDKTSWRLGYGALIAIPLAEWPEGARKYPEVDAGATMAVHKAQQEWAEYLENGPAQAEAAFALHLMSCYGLRTDPAQCARIRQATTQTIERARETCQAAGLVDGAGKRNMAPARDLMLKAFTALGEPVPLTDTGVKAAEGLEVMDPAEVVEKGLQKYVSLDEEACIDSGNPVLEAFAIYGSAKTRLAKVETLEQGTRIPLQTRFDPLKETGRTSSRAPGPPLVGDNFQNFARAGGYVKKADGGWIVTPSPASRFRLFGPFKAESEAQAFVRGIDPRGCVVPRPGFLLCSVDYDGAELHTLAQVCLWAVGHSRLAEVLNAGQDPHLLLGAERLLAEPLTYEQALANKRDPAIKYARQVAKVPNFGLPGGLGAKTLIKYAKQYGVTLTLGEAENLIANWHETWPEMADYFAWIKSMLGDGLATIEQFVSKRIRGLIPYSVACNTFFQGLAADAAKSALLPLARECYLEQDSPLYGSRPILFIHDEVIAEVPEETAHLAGPRMADLMVRCFNEWVPDCPVTASPALMYRWTKEAEPTYSEGKLVPWEPKAAA